MPPSPNTPETTPGITIRKVPWDHPAALPLRAAQQTEMIALGVSYRDATPLTAKDIPVFYLAYADGKAVGCGGLRPVVARPKTNALGTMAEDGKGNEIVEGKWGHGLAEVKRMFVVPEYRGLVTVESTVEEGAKRVSVAGLMLERLEEEARGWGCGTLVLATAACLVGANRFYTRCGFVPCPIFGAYGEEDESLYYEKRLNGFVLEEAASEAMTWCEQSA